MANLVNTTIMMEGTTKAVLHFYFESDGVEGEFRNRVLFDPSNDFLIPAQAQVDDLGNIERPKVTIVRAWPQFAWFDVTLSSEGTTPYPMLVFPRDTELMVDYHYMNGVKDRNTDNPTGRLLITTNNFAPLGSAGTLILEVRKD